MLDPKLIRDSPELVRAAVPHLLACDVTAREPWPALDELDPFPGRYTLEVSSPGLERRLRTPGHFERAIGEMVTVRTLPDTVEVRRVRGVVTAADAAGLTLEGPEVPGGSMRIAYDQIERARTVFEWGPVGRPERGSKANPGAKRQERERSRS